MHRDDQIKRLVSQVERLQECSMFDAREQANACLYTAMNIIAQFDERLTVLEGEHYED